MPVIRTSPRPVHNGFVATVVPNKKLKIRQMMKLFEQNYSVEQVAEKLQVAERTIYKWKKRQEAKIVEKYERNVIAERHLQDLRYNWALRELIEQWEASKVNSKKEPCRANVVYMDRILAIWEAQRKMHGLDVPVDKNKTPDDDIPRFDWRSLTSMQVIVNNNGVQPTAQQVEEKADKIVKEEFVNKIERTIETKTLQNEVAQRIQELERRVKEKEERDEEEQILRDKTPIVVKRKLVIKAKPVIVTHSLSSQETTSVLGEE